MRWKALTKEIEGLVKELAGLGKKMDEHKEKGAASLRNSNSTSSAWRQNR